MALSDAYCTVEEYRDRAEKTSDADDDAIESEIVAVARYIDRVTVRPLGFNRDPANGATVARVFETCYGGRTLDIYDYLSISQVAIDSAGDGTFATVLSASDWEGLPRANSMPEVWPFNRLVATTGGNLGSWPIDTKIRVTGYGGWPAVPAAVKSANIELTRILRLESDRATQRVNELGQVLSISRTARDILAELVATYRLKRTLI